MAISLSACSSSSFFLEAYAPEESTLNLVKITDEANNTILAGNTLYIAASMVANSSYGISKGKIIWATPSLLSVSPDGTKIAYCTRSNGQDNVMVRNANTQGVSTQRTFRNVGSFSWGNDDNLYISDVNGANSYICYVNAEVGSLMNQLTNGSVWDSNPVVSADGKKVFFTRDGEGGPSIWSLNKDNGTLTLCARGFNPCLIPDNSNAFYCVRNSTNGRSELWYVDFVNGQESLVLSDENRSFTNPALSPDGKWIACTGNSVSSISKKHNLDIYVVRTNGSNLTQLTYHPESDVCPAWASDGKSIFFLSSRANKSSSFNIWRMNFML